MELEALIIKRIRDEGPLSFHDFMEICLYYPELGYYTDATDKIGKNGDYYTSSSLGNLFGVLIGRQLEEMWEIMGEGEFTIIEYGAGPGILCRDILNYLEKNPAFYSRLHYCIIEKSPAMREKEKKILPPKVKWADSIKELGPVTGCILSNELVDNFSTHRVVMQERLMEVYVDYNDGFMEILRPAGEPLLRYLEELNVDLPEGFCTEINLEATQWIEEIGSSLNKGYVMTIDYGCPSDKLYNNSRRNGTLMCYHKHSVSDRPYEQPGKQDITSHVNFSALTHWGSKKGLETLGLTSQAGFFSGLGWDDSLRELLLQNRDPYLNFRNYAFLKYTYLIDMGQKFSVLVQSKGLPHLPLRGLAANSNRRLVNDEDYHLSA